MTPARLAALGEQVVDGARRLASGAARRPWPEPAGSDRAIARRGASRRRSTRRWTSSPTIGRVLRQGPIWRLPEHQPRLTRADERLWERVHPLLTAEDLRPPRVRELAATLGLEPECGRAFPQSGRATGPRRSCRRQPFLSARDAGAPRRDRARARRWLARRHLHCRDLQGPLRRRPQSDDPDSRISRQDGCDASNGRRAHRVARRRGVRLNGADRLGGGKSIGPGGARGLQIRMRVFNLETIGCGSQTQRLLVAQQRFTGKPCKPSDTALGTRSPLFSHRSLSKHRLSHAPPTRQNDTPFGVSLFGHRAGLALSPLRLEHTPRGSWPLHRTIRQEFR